jgi:hypothetical protein
MVPAYRWLIVRTLVHPAKWHTQLVDYGMLAWFLTVTLNSGCDHF